jgi:GTP-binding protein
MVNGVILLVDAAEGPMPQTKFVLMKALKLGLKPIVIINKVDRPDRRIEEVLSEVFDLFVALEANDDQLDFPVLYASGRNGWATIEPETQGTDLQPLFGLIKDCIPAPKVDKEAPFAMLATILTHDLYVGRVLIGKVYSGTAAIGTAVKSINLKGELIENTKLTKLFGFQGIERINIDVAEAGDIVAIAGIEKSSVSDTICVPSVTEPIKTSPIDPPTMAVTIGVNDSPLSGQEGTKVTSRMILDRLNREAQVNVAITLKISASGEAFEVGGIFPQSCIPCLFINKMEEYNAILGQQQIENIHYTLFLIESYHKNDKVEGLIKKNVQKCYHINCFPPSTCFAVLCTGMSMM